MTSGGDADPKNSGQLVVLVYLLFALVGVVAMFFGAYLLLEEAADFADGGRSFSYLGWHDIVQFAWPFAFGLGIWLAGAAIRWMLTGERAFPLRWGRVPMKTPAGDDAAG